MELMTKVDATLKSKAKGKGWAEGAAPILLEVNKQIKKVEADREEDMAPYKALFREINEKYTPALAPLEQMDERLRGRMLREYTETETIVTDEGQIQFPQKWGYEVKDLVKIPKEYLVTVVDSKKVGEEIKKGVRNIKGLEIKPVRSMRVVCADGK